MTRDELAQAFASVIAEAMSYWCGGYPWSEMGPLGCKLDGDGCQCRNLCYRAADIALTSSSPPSDAAPGAGEEPR